MLLRIFNILILARVVNFSCFFTDYNGKGLYLFSLYTTIFRRVRFTHQLQLKKYLKDYEKSQKYFKKKNNDMYLKLKDKLNNAIEHSSQLKKFDHYGMEDVERAICEMNTFFELDEIKQALQG